MKTRYLKLIIAALVIAIIGIAYAATQLSIQNTGTVILGNKNFQGITFSPPASQPNCATQSTYGDGGGTGTLTPIAWGSIVQGSSSTAYICVKNADGAGQTYSVTTGSLSPSTGITVNYNGTATLNSPPQSSSGTSLIIVTVSVASSVPVGPFSYTTTIG